MVNSIFILRIHGDMRISMSAVIQYIAVIVGTEKKNHVQEYGKFLLRIIGSPAGALAIHKLTMVLIRGYGFKTLGKFAALAKSGDSNNQKNIIIILRIKGENM